MLFLPFLIYFWPTAQTLKCFSCASSEYKLVLERSKAFSRSSRTPHFDTMCDEETAVQQMAPVENCQSTCITIYEPQYFGEDVLIGFLNLWNIGRERASVCVALQLSQIYPHVQQNEIVEVCSCTDNGCNYQAAPLNSSTFPPTLLIILLVLTIF